MKNEEKLLINVCKSYFSGSELSLPKEVDWNEFYQTAKNHNLTSVCHCVFNENKEKVPEKVQAFFLDKFFDLIYVYENQVNKFDEIKNLLNSEEIPFIPFKGIVLREVYPVAESRTMGDIDILIKPFDSKRLKTTFEKAGFIYDNTSGYVDTYRNGNVIVEVHSKLDESFGDKFDDAFEHGIFNGFEGRFDDSYHFAYLIAHTAKHIKNQGAGIRFILDAALMLKNKNIDSQKVFEKLKELNLVTFGKVVFSLCNKWFGYGENFISDTEKIQEYFIKSGVFGGVTDSKGTTVARLKTVNALDNSSKNSPFKLKLRLAFPNYEALTKLPYIKFIKGRPWLTPAAWAYRFFYNIKNSKAQMMEKIKNINDKSTIDMANEELKFLEEVGLI